MLTRALSTCLRRLADSCVQYAVDVHGASAAACVGYASAGAAIPSRPASVCIIGSGPAGFYTAQELIRTYGDDVAIDILDRLPTPFGLVRTGVAPDHADTKKVINQFNRIAQDGRVELLCNVRVGQDVMLTELRQLYDAVVLAYGAEGDRRLGIPGEDSAGVHAAREFVWWYNGHPDQACLPVDLSRVHAVAVAGIGNVALDCARLLLRPPGDLEHTDVARHALEQMRRSSVKQVHLCARRGPVQAACTPKELRELLSMPDVRVCTAPEQLAVSVQDEAEMKSTRIKRRVYEIMVKAAADARPSATKQLQLQLYRNPVEIIADADKQVQALRVEVTRVVADPTSGRAVALGTGVFEELPVQLVLKSIGYRGLPLEGAPFDVRAGVVPNAAGRVLADGAHVPGLYVCGWLKRGPTGIIGTNLTDAEETVAALAADRAAGAPRWVTHGGVGGRPFLRTLLSQRCVPVVDLAAWKRLDDVEVAAGIAAGGVPRIKVVEPMAALAAAGVSSAVQHGTATRPV